MVWCIHKTLPVGQAALGTHAHMEHMHMQSPGPTCFGRRKPPFKAMAGTPLPVEMRRRSMQWTFILLLLQSYRWRHTQSTSEVSSEGAVLPRQGAAKIYPPGYWFTAPVLGMTAEGHCTTGLEMGAQCVSPIKYLLLFTGGHFFLGINVICDLLNKYTN